ncbi:unnamed protein product [Brassica rapa]|uniref:Uncharacterized protein n=1 Tax=Brassica campestris TaxID=3711 RepID=A0A8D9G9Y8_BRACM|nr:unnamed protein product [Brassica rapa]
MALIQTQYEPFDASFPSANCDVWPHPNAFREAQLCQRQSVPIDRRNNCIPCFGFGRSTNHDEKVFSFHCDSSYALSIVIVSVGDVPWADMRKFDDMIPKREFNNFLLRFEVRQEFFSPI